MNQPKGKTMSATITPPLKWHGGKHYLASKIVALINRLGHRRRRKRTWSAAVLHGMDSRHRKSVQIGWRTVLHKTAWRERVGHTAPE
jgi:hypothetical protein